MLTVASVLVPALVLVAGAFGIGVIIKQRFDFMPKLSYAGIGVKFAQGADEHQEGLPEACLAIGELVREKFPEVAEELLSLLVIEMNGKDAVMTSFSIPTGRVYRADGSEAILYGTTDTHRPTPFESPRFVVKVRQRYTADGKLRDVGATALFHEVMEHVLPKLVENDWNAAHKVEWTLVTHEVLARYKLEMGTAHLK